MQRRRFENLVLELSLAAGRCIPRYRLWLLLQNQGADPACLGRSGLTAFCDRHLESFLAEQGAHLRPRALRRLRRRLLRFDPRYPTPCETMERILGAHG